AQREVLALVLEAQETERARVARDLHDQIGQTLTSVLLGLRLLDDALAGDADDFGAARGRCGEARELVVEALDEVRRLAFDLRPTVLDDVGLVAAVRRLAGDLTSRSGVRIDLALGPLADHSRLPPDIETVVYRVVQEALTNVARHSQASFATVTVDARVDRIHASIADDGVGFEVGELQRRSLGLAGMAERAALAGGTLTVRSAPTTGTTVVLEVPL
ncbi:MAG: sensor histidine kinase, partial [Acidimicrobiia bacterium]